LSIGSRRKLVRAVAAPRGPHALALFSSGRGAIGAPAIVWRDRNLLLGWRRKVLLRRVALRLFRADRNLNGGEKREHHGDEE
jgi:hypothetical protein